MKIIRKLKKKVAKLETTSKKTFRNEEVEKNDNGNVEDNDNGQNEKNYIEKVVNNENEKNDPGAFRK